jgi:cyclic pyranopterin phosphate synthase
MVRYLRVSLLRGCNLKCVYCRPTGSDSLPEAGRYTIDQYTAAIRLLYDFGIRKVRFTGGEPTLYRQLPDLIGHTNQLADVKTAITTNGLLLSRLAETLSGAGLASVNISVDTLNRSKFRMITSTDRFQDVISGIEASVKYIPLVKLNTVVIKGINDDEVNDLILFADRMGISIRFIEYMPTMMTKDGDRGYISGNDIMTRLPYDFSPVERTNNTAARYYRSPDLNIVVGFINPVSHPFCDGCDRLRLASDGRLYGCLFSSSSTNLFELLENGREAAVREIARLIENKKYLGCPGLNETQNHLPSFITMGG